MNIKLYGIVTAVIVTGVIGMMYIMPSAEAASHSIYDTSANKKIFPYLDQFDQYSSKSTVYEGYGKDLTTEEWIDFLKHGGFSRPLCLYSAETYNCTWRGALYWDYCEHHDEHWGHVVHQWYGDKYNRITEYHFVKYCERLIDTALYANELFTSNIIQSDIITKLEADINEKNDRITSLESKADELVLIEKNASTLQEKIDKKNTQLENKNKRINNLQGQIKDNTSGIRDLIDTLKADPNTSTDDILEALKRLLQ